MKRIISVKITFSWIKNWCADELSSSSVTQNMHETHTFIYSSAISKWCGKMVCLAKEDNIPQSTTIYQYLMCIHTASRCRLSPDLYWLFIFLYWWLAVKQKVFPLFCFFVVFLSLLMYEKLLKMLMAKVLDEFPSFSSIYYTMDPLMDQFDLEVIATILHISFDAIGILCAPIRYEIFFHTLFILRQWIASNVDVSNSLFPV